MKNGKVQIGVVGLGMGRWHLQNYLKCSNANVIALCDIDERRLKAAQEEHKIPQVFTDYEKLFQLDELDGVTVALPNYLHAPVSIAALKADKNVLVEKPMARNSEEAKKMVQAAKKSSKILMMHFNYRFTPEFFFMKRYIESGKMGDIYLGRAFYIRRRGIPGMGSWFTKKEQSGGGALVDIGVHILDLSLWLMGYPKMTKVLGSAYAKFGPERAKAAKTKFDVDDLTAAFIKFDNGASLFLEASWASNIEKDEVYVELLGTKAGISNRNGWKIYTESEEGAMLDMIPSRTSGAETPQQHFVNCIQQGKPPICPGEHGLEVQRILDAIYTSA